MYIDYCVIIHLIRYPLPIRQDMVIWVPFEHDLGPPFTHPAVACCFELHLALAHCACLQSGLYPTDDMRYGWIRLSFFKEPLRVSIDFIAHHMNPQQSVILLQAFINDLTVCLLKVVM